MAGTGAGIALETFALAAFEAKLNTPQKPTGMSLTATGHGHCRVIRLFIEDMLTEFWRKITEMLASSRGGESTSAVD